VRIDGVEQRSVGVEKRCNEVEEQSDGAVERSDGVVDWRRGRATGGHARRSCVLGSGQWTRLWALSFAGVALPVVLVVARPSNGFCCRKIDDFELIFPSLTQVVGRNAD